MTHTHADLVVRRKVRKATAAAVHADRIFNPLDDNYFDHGTHPTTLIDERWEDRMYNALWANYDGRFADADHKSRLSKEADDYVMACIHGINDARADNFDDADNVILHAQGECDYVDPRAYGEDHAYPLESGMLPNFVENGNFPAWDDPEHGLEVRMSREYEVMHGLAA
jgi:hypothetical protein